jgi:EamA-like transporter family.
VNPSPPPVPGLLLGVFLCVLVWGANYPATKIAYRELSPLAYTGWRFLLAAALIPGPWPRGGEEPTPPVLPPAGASGFRASCSR